MIKYYKDEGTHLIINGKNVICITVYDEKNVDVSVVEHFDAVYDYSDLEECDSKESLSILQNFENRCKEIINSTGL